jgi:hypothetical protein
VSILRYWVFEDEKKSGISIYGDESFEFSMFVPLMKVLRLITSTYFHIYIYLSTKSAIVYFPIVKFLHRQYRTSTTPIVANTRRIRMTTKPEVERLGLQEV